MDWDKVFKDKNTRDLELANALCDSLGEKGFIFPGVTILELWGRVREELTRRGENAEIN